MGYIKAETDVKIILYAKRKACVRSFCIHMTVFNTLIGYENVK